MTQAQEEEFRRFLEGLETHGKHLTEKAINSRIAKAKKAEQVSNMDIEKIVASDATMRRVLINLRPGDTRGNRANAVRKYYEMRRGKVFPKIRDAE